MKKQPLVSIIVPTKNSAKFLDQCLLSIKNQTYENIEIIVVDNFSSDNTVQVAKKYTKKIFKKGNERSTQVNFGVKQARGEYVYKVDSDFLLNKNIVKQCLQKIKHGYDAIVVHNSPDVKVSWIAKIRKFEVDMYKYDLTHASARFLKKPIYIKLGGYNEKITAGQDYDLQNKINRANYKTAFVNAEAIHLGEPKSFWKHLLKYYDYGNNFVIYQQINKEESKKQLSFFRKVYFKNWRKFIKQPILGIGFIFYNICKYSFGGAGFLTGKIKSKFIFKDK